MRTARLKALPNSKKVYKKGLTKATKSGIIIVEKGVKTMYGFRRLDWMTNEEYDKVYWYWGCVCDYDNFWKDEQDFEAWCKRVLAK
jgi:hypothetical protein